MSKRNLIIFVFIFLLIQNFIYNQEDGFPELNSNKQVIVSLKIEDYRIYLRNHPSLDRLYCTDNTCFFLVNNTELSEIKQTGLNILSYEALTGFNSLSNERVDSQKGDINGAYHNYSETNDLLRQLESRYPSIAQVSTIGYSLEGRELNAIKISDNVDKEENEPNVFIIGCHHAREWISVEIPLLFAQYLLEHYQDDPEVQRAVNGAQVYIVPMVNPDGLEFSIHTYRMWRKNRRNNGDLTWGVDINRNYGYMWGHDDEGSSPNTFNDDYRGPFPFSEPETEAVRQYLLLHPPAGTLSYHNFSQLIIYPWGYTYTPAEDADEMDKIAAEMSSRIFQVNGRMYTYGAANILYLTNGDTLDWVYGTFGTPAYTIELPPEYMVLGGFFTSIEMIEETFNENRPAMLYFVNYFINESDLNSSPLLKGTTLSQKREDR